MSLTAPTGVQYNCEQGAKNSEKSRKEGKEGKEGKEYIFKDGDALHFLFNVFNV